MRNFFLKAIGITLLALLTLQVSAQDIKWSVNKKARPYVARGMGYIMNNENEMAYPEFQKAVTLDPNATVALYYLATITTGNVRQNYSQRTMQSLEGKTDGEKLFFSSLDTTLSQKQRADLYEKLHVMYPGSVLFSGYYSFTRSSDETRLGATQEMIRQFPNEGFAYNNLGYLYMNYKKDMRMAKQSFEKYIALYPDGCNAYDSMGEYYLNNGDYPNARKYYQMALEKYPFYTNSIIKLQEISKVEKARTTGNN